MNHRPTAEQAAIVAAAKTGADLVIEAGAGTGKTSTLKMLAAEDARCRGVYIAYNRAIATDAARDFPRTVTCKTAHALAFGAIGRQFAHRLGGPRVPAQRTAQILGINGPVKVGEVMLSPQQLARLVMSTVGRWCYTGDAAIGPMHVPIVPGIDRAGQAELARHLAPIAQRAWSEDLSRAGGQLRYQHDYYLKAWTLTNPQLPADYVLLDEAQDANGCVAALVAAQRGQRIVVGDSAQAIYGWRGATDYMRVAPGDRYQLSQSWRFGAGVAAEANRWLGLLDAPLRLSGYDAIDSRIGPVEYPDAVLCRTNAGAMTEVVDAMRANRGVALVGGGAEIRRFAIAAGQLQCGAPTDHPDLLAFATWGQVKAYVEEEEDGSDLRAMVRLVDDHTPTGLLRLVDSLVDERHADVVVSTAHKAKGREWPWVRIARDFSAPKPRDDGPVDLDRGELMLAYVATTRAREVLDRGSLAWIDDYASPAEPGVEPPAPPPAEVVEIAPRRAAPPAIPADDIPTPHCWRCGGHDCTCGRTEAAVWSARCVLPAGPVADRRAWLDLHAGQYLAAVAAARAAREVTGGVR
jgi:hypothetical protein